MVAKPLTAEERQRQVDAAKALFAPRYKTNMDAYNADPRVGVANALLKQGTSFAPIQGGIGEGIARIGAGALGGMFGRQERDKWGLRDELMAAADNRNLGPKIKEAVTPVVPDAVPVDPLAAAAAAAGGGTGQAAINAAQAAPGLIQPGGAPPTPPPPAVPAAAPAAALSGPVAPSGPGAGPSPSPLVANPTVAPVGGAPTTGQFVSVPSAAPQRTTRPEGTPRVLVPGQSARAVSRQQSRSMFDNAYEGFTASHEGGFNKSDPRTGQAVNFGIDQRAHPNIDVSKLTRDQAKNIMYNEYWKPSGAANLPQDLATVHFDTYVLNPKKANEILAASGGDVGTYLGLRRQFLSSLGGPTQEGWAKRDADLAQHVGAGSANDNTVGGDGVPRAPDVPMQEIPAAPEAKPIKAPTLADRVRSTRLGIVNNLLNDQDPNLTESMRGTIIDRYLDEGLNEDQAAKLQRDQQLAAQAQTGYQGDINYRNQMAGEEYRARTGEVAANNQLGRELKKDEYGYHADAAAREDQQQFDTTRDTTRHNWDVQDATTAYNRQWATDTHQADLRKATEAEKRDARQAAWLGTPQGQKAQAAGRDGVAAAAKMGNLLDQFESAYNDVTQGGLQNIGPVGRFVGAVSGNQNIGIANHASQAMASLLGEQLKGSMSDSDREWLQRSVPSLANSKGVNTGTIKAMRQLNQREQDYWSQYNEAIAAGGPQKVAEFQNSWDKYINAVSLDPTKTKNYVTYDQWLNRKVLR